jgi:hypothetical protein
MAHPKLLSNCLRPVLRPFVGWEHPTALGAASAQTEREVDRSVRVSGGAGRNTGSIHLVTRGDKEELWPA